MSKLLDRPLTAAEYDEMALAYSRTLPLEHFMESIPQAYQRKIMLESLDLLHARNPRVQLFNELLIQYRVQGEVRRVVPDNMVRLYDKPPITKGSFNPEIEPVGPFWVLEWTSASSEGKDYGDALHKYEHDLKVPYCLIFHYEIQDLRVLRHNGKRYERVKENDQGRLPIPDLEIEIGQLDGWARVWHRGELLELPADLEQKLDVARQKATDERRRADQEKQRAEHEKIRAEQEKARADQETRRADEERRQRLATELELARLQAELAKHKAGPQS